MTFTFTIDCFPAYTKFNKSKKVMAALQVLDPTDTRHNYADKGILGHDNRSADDDGYIKSLYPKQEVNEDGTPKIDDQGNPVMSDEQVSIFDQLKN